MPRRLMGCDGCAKTEIVDERTGRPAGWWAMNIDSGEAPTTSVNLVLCHGCHAGRPLVDLFTIARTKPV